MTDALLTRVAVALHGVTPPDPEGALALHRDAAARVVAALGDGVERVLRQLGHFPIRRPAKDGDMCRCCGFTWPCATVYELRKALTTEPTP